MVKQTSVVSTSVKCLLYFMLYTLLEMPFYFWPFAILIGSDSTERRGNVVGNDIGK